MSPLLAQRYELRRILGEGAMGRVYLAFDTLTAQEVALKVISDPGVELGTEKTHLQFQQEFRLMTRLGHPNCCEVYDYGVAEDGAPYFTMEVVPGHGLDELLPLSPDRFRDVFAQLMLALGHVHQRGFVHLDLKPANVRVRPDGVVKLMDFGLMEVAGLAPPAIRGTLPYVAPELIRRAPLDGRADLYSAGILGFELLTGKPPFERPSAAELLRAHLSEAPPAVTAAAPGVPAELGRLIRGMLAKEPAQRFASAGDALADLGVAVPPGLGGSLLAAPLVGRDEELAALQDQVDATVAEPRLRELWLWGPAGVGKSRLLDEVRCRAQLAELPFVLIASHEIGGAPYASLVALLRGLMPGMRARVPDALARHAPVLSTLVPELAAAPAPAMASPRDEAMRLHVEVTALLTAYAAAQPIVIVVEDWRGIDAPSRDALAYVRRNAQAAAILLVASTRRGPEVPGGPADMPDRPLTGLGPVALEAMVAGMLGTTAIAPAFAARVAELTAGVPRDVEQLLDHLVKAGRLVRHDGRWDTAIDLPDDAVPGGLAGQWRRLLAALPPTSRAVAIGLAAIGRPIGLELLQAITDVGTDPLFEALEDLTRRRLIQRDEAGAYAFARRDEREALLALLAPDEASPVHARATDALLTELAGRLIAEAPFELVAALAFHGVEAGRGVAALPWTLEAARRSLALAALADAERFLAAATKILAGLPAHAAPAERLARARMLADVKRHGGAAAEAEPLYAEAIALAEAAQDARALGELRTSLANVHQVRGQYAEAIACADRALVDLVPLGDDPGASRCLQVRARARFFLGDTAGAVADGEAALAHGQAAGSLAAQGMAQATLGFFLTQGDATGVERGLGFLREAVRSGEAQDDRWGQLYAHNMLGNALTARGEFAEAVRSFEVCERISLACGVPREQAFALVNLAIVALEMGDMARARDAAVRTRDLAAGLGAKLPHGMALALLGQAEGALGHVAPARADMAEGLALARAIGNKYLEALLLPRAAELALSLGLLDEAAAQLEALTALMAETNNQEPAGRRAMLLAELARQRGDAAEATTLARRAANEAQARGERGLALAATCVEAQAAADGAQWDTVRRLATEGLALADALGAAGRAAELRGLLGLAAVRTGGDAAAEHFAAMEAWAEQAAAPVPLATALFGRAAAAPYSDQAADRAARAQALLAGLTAALTPAEAQAFLAASGRAIIHAGDYRAFARPPEEAPRRASGPLSLGMGGFGPP